MAIITCTDSCTPGQGRCTAPAITHEGLVLGLFERNGRTDSDSVAAVWNPSTRSIDAIVYSTTRWQTYHNTATPDAPEDIVEAARQWLTFRAVEKARDLALRDVRVGCWVRSITTRGKNKGLVGRVGAVVRNKYGSGHRVRIDLDEGLVSWMDIEKVRVTGNPLEVAAECKRAAGQVAIANREMLARLYHSIIG